jgi:hypothetical protein
MTLPQPPAGKTTKGATDFVNYWFEVLSYATATGDTAPLVRASSQHCQSCTAAAGAVRSGYRDGGSLRGGQYTVRRVTIDTPVDAGHTVIAGTVFDRGPQWLVGADGTVLSELPGVTFNSCQILLTWEADHWQVVDQLCGHPTPRALG